MGQDQAPPEKAQGFKVAGKEFKDQEEFVRSGRRCDTPVPTENQIRRARLAADAVRGIAGAENYLNPQNNVTIRVAFHVIHSGDQGKLPQGQIEQQIGVLDKAFGESGFDFDLAQVDFTDVEGTEREDWFTMAHISPKEREAKRLLGKDPEHASISTPPTWAMGSSAGPRSPRTSPSTSSATASSCSTPAFPPRTAPPTPTAVPTAWGTPGPTRSATGSASTILSRVAASPPGDEVADTPSHQANVGCPSTVPDTCTLDMQRDPIKNYMNYTDDACMSELSPGQIGRMREQTTTFRPLLFVGTSELRSRIREAVRAAGR